PEGAEGAAGTLVARIRETTRGATVAWIHRPWRWSPDPDSGLISATFQSPAAATAAMPHIQAQLAQWAPGRATVAAQSPAASRSLSWFRARVELLVLGQSPAESEARARQIAAVLRQAGVGASRTVAPSAGPSWHVRWDEAALAGRATTRDAVDAQL